MAQAKIVVAIDGSTYSDRVIDKAVQYCTLVEGKVMLVYCHRRISKIIGQPARDKYIPMVKKEAQDLVAPFVERLKGAGLTVEERLMEEPAGEAISDVAAIEKCDLIIMGCRGLSNLAGLFVGSVTSRVLHTAPCSVFVVK